MSDRWSFERGDIGKELLAIKLVLEAALNAVATLVVVLFVAATLIRALPFVALVITVLLLLYFSSSTTGRDRDDHFLLI